VFSTVLFSLLGTPVHGTVERFAQTAKFEFGSGLADRKLLAIRIKAMGLRQRPQTVPPIPDEIQLSNSNSCSRPLDPLDRPRNPLLWSIRVARTVDKTVDSVRGVHPFWVGQ
jgi:hypothetical protein